MEQIAHTLDVEAIRAQFPALASGRIHLDNPGGTQVHGSVIEAISDYYLNSNANGNFTASSSNLNVTVGYAAAIGMIGATAMLFVMVLLIWIFRPRD